MGFEMVESVSQCKIQRWGIKLYSLFKIGVLFTLSDKTILTFLVLIPYEERKLT